ncbi:ricin-type beta-trefoil lectin domain protein [Streptomyces sp. SCSIO 30461]|uniref:ricin-type beta-trefoil lectin domain protein n=1 Tax=Streptomyces sp. SCSIO 30461 TaxID=3118085 RepID=UPI0030CB85A5
MLLLRFRPGLFNPRSRSSTTLTSAIASVAALTVLSGLAVQPDLVTGDARGRLALAGEADDWFEETPAEELRQDQCLMSDVLRIGGKAMSAVAQDGLNQSQDKLHELADPEYWKSTPLSQAYKKDRDAAAKDDAALEALWHTWKKPLEGLTEPPIAQFDEPPGGPGPLDDEGDFYYQTGLSKWIDDRFWKNESDFYEDPTPKADKATVKAVKDLGKPLYGNDPDPNLPEWGRQVDEYNAFEYLLGSSLEPMGADNARIFLASGGFPRTAPQPGTAEFRIAVEDLKTRFAGCAWRDPIDPNEALGNLSATAAQEWQQEIASQAAQRNQILTTNKDATKALAAGAKTLGDLLGHSWAADRLARWQDYWSAGGVGWIGKSYVTIEVPGAKGMCLDIEGNAKVSGADVQIYTCNGGDDQRWSFYGGDENQLHISANNSDQCLGVAGNKSANGTKVQLSDCDKSTEWKVDVQAASTLRSLSTGKCLDLSALDKATDVRVWDCKGTSAQKFLIKPSGDDGTDRPDYPDKAQFDKAKKGVTDTQAAAKKQLAVLKVQLESAKKSGTASDAAEQVAYGIADAAGAPRGRGLLVGQQKAQVTKGVVAALTAMVKAGETAEAATRASAGDSATIAQRALAQAAQVNAEFRKEAAHKAELQAKAAADAAKLHRDNAKKDKETAEAKLAVALKAEADAKAAAADAHAKRLAAEAEEKTAKAEKETAAAKQAEANQHKQTAQAEATNAQDAKEKAEAAEATAAARKNAAVKARDNARDLNDDAWDAAQKADSARAKADAKEAYAQAHEADSNAQESRAAANAADAYASDAEAASARAQAAADAASQAAAEADAAATRAEAAAKRARSNADAAEAAKLKADAAVGTSTSAAADAIDAAQHASDEANYAVKMADEAEQESKTAKSEADKANKEAIKALAAAAKAAGFAHVTAQAAVDAGNAAAQVAKPANDAIQLGSPYVTTDSAASLVVLVGQASKSIANQQKAVADAHAKNAQAEAAAAKNLADQATGDAKIAYQYAANAATHAANARTYSKEALGYAASAATAASKASASLARAVEYGQQATADAAVADQAAGRAEGYAKDARASADQAALDAQAARQAAAAAEQAAKDARAAADRAAVAATEAEQAAKDALKYAQEAQKAVEEAARNAANKQVATGAATGIGGTWTVVNEDTIEITAAKQHNDCVIEIGFEGCEVTFTVTFNAVVDFFLCTNPDVPADATGCPSEDTLLIESKPFPGLQKKVTSYFSKLDLIEMTAAYKILKAVLVQDFVDCYHGSASGCAWAASNFIPGKAFGKLTEALWALDAALKTGIGVADAFKALKAIEGLDPSSIAKVERTMNAYEDAFTSCRVNSFPADTPVLMADGSRRPIAAVGLGDLVMATDPNNSQMRPEPVTDTFQHPADRLLTIGLAGGSSLDTTPGHKIRVHERGWVLASELRPGDRLLSPNGSLRAVTEVRDRSGLVPRQVYDLTVSGLHTFYVTTDGPQSADVLVHNCLSLSDENLSNLSDYELHTLSKHVNPQDPFAEAKPGRPNTVWTNAEIAQQAVDRVVSDYFHMTNKHGQKVLDTKKWKAFEKWLAKADDGEKYPAIEGSWNAYPSLGKVYHADRSITNAGNGVRVVLKKTKHKGRGGFSVYTAYPV